MYLVRLIYASRAREGFGPNDVEQILGVARKTNAQKGITGMLCFNGYNFLQSLEGSRTAVNELYRHILEDKRHFDTTLLEYREIVARDFDNWHMGYLGLTKENQALLLRFSNNLEFDPFKMSGATAHAMLCELSAILQ
ncbi:BLUF domain-containing protein [Methylotuvimicrobium sp. KM1]|uniref:BLUF domain-containing protein n=1 Tax=Methylotuvimicrobium sp. KM1 TaxID=3377707 RepID=UPI00384D1E3E